MSCSLERPPARSATRSAAASRGRSSSCRSSSSPRRRSGPTVSVITVSGGCCVPPCGVWLESTSAVRVRIGRRPGRRRATRKPDDCSVCSAEPRSMLVTSGTVEVFGPFETVSVTTEPLPADAPAAGVWSITVFAGCVVSTKRRADLEARRLQRRASPGRSAGRRRSARRSAVGPFETLMRTVCPTGSFVPAGGSCAVTSPAGLLDGDLVHVRLQVQPRQRGDGVGRLLPDERRHARPSAARRDPDRHVAPLRLALACRRVLLVDEPRGRSSGSRGG